VLDTFVLIFLSLYKLKYEFCIHILHTYYCSRTKDVRMANYKHWLLHLSWYFIVNLVQSSLDIIQYYF
jgi:hypothetical protein